MSARYRLRQLASALGARLAPAELRLVESTLSPGELELFRRMPRFDQRHCLDVYQTLCGGGYTDPLLLRAALLHDCGKVDDQGCPIPLLYYGLFVVLRRLAPWAYAWAARNGRGPLRPFAVHAIHEQRSAALAAAAGSPPGVVAILRDYANRHTTPATAALHWADDLN
ncbi:MAG: HDIG domain-containing protein [Roseiflexaceae bacterium]